MQKNAIKENHDFSLILAKYSLILLEKKTSQEIIFSHTMKQDLNCIQLLLERPQKTISVLRQTFQAV